MSIFQSGNVNNIDSIAGQGTPLQVVPALPANGVATLSVPVPADRRWQFESALLLNVTDGTTGTRSLGLQFLAGGLASFGNHTAIYAIPPSFSVTNTFSKDVQASAESPLGSSATIVTTRIPDYLLNAGDTMLFTLSNIGVADVWFIVQIRVREWIL